MNTVAAVFTASTRFVGSLFQRRAKVSGLSTNGHRMMENWNGCPEEQILAAVEAIRNSPGRPARVALFGLDGPHTGEYFVLANGVELIGRDSQCSVVLTPREMNRRDRCRVFINGTVRLLAETGSHFKVNGQEIEQCELFDYDEVELLGNRFLVLVNLSQDAKTGKDKHQEGGAL